MSQTLSVYSPVSIHTDEFAEFVQQVGRFFFNEARDDVGVSRGESHVWIYGVHHVLSGDFEEPDEAVTARLGHVVKTRLDLQLSSATGSEMLALDVALAFTKRWPSSVATTAVNRVLSLREMDLRTNERTDVSNLLGEGVDLMVTTMPALSAVILEYGGILIPDFGADQEIAQQWAREMNLRPDPSKGRILGFVFEPSAGLCVLTPTPCVDEGVDDGGVASKVHKFTRAKLSQAVRWHVGVLAGRSAAHEKSSSLAMAFTRRILRECEGVAAGLFEMVLDVKDIARLRNIGVFVDG